MLLYPCVELTDCASDVVAGALHTLKFVNTCFCVTQLVAHIAVTNIAGFSGPASVEVGSEGFIS